MEFHPAANIFPLLEGAEFEALKADLKQHGQLESIWTHQGEILDGRNRYRACTELDLLPVYSEFKGDDPVAFVVSLNLHRRHLDASQRSMVSRRIATIKQGARTDLEPSANLHEVSQTEAAHLMNVSERLVKSAGKVIDHGTPELAAMVDSGRVSVSAAADVAELPQDRQREIVARGEKEILRAAKQIRGERAIKRRDERIEKIVEIGNTKPALEFERQYPIIYADPPWRYDYAESDARVIENQYPTMALDEICALPVPKIAQDDCILFMWTTSPKLRDSMDVLDAWGFTYRTCAVWDKEVIGMGYYFRQQHELLLVAMRGSIPTPEPANRPSSIFVERRSKHSSKPDIAYQIIEAMYPTLPKVELFARSVRDGWAVWGNQAT